MKKLKKPRKTTQKPLDGGSTKRPLGRPGVLKSEIQTRAFHYHRTMQNYWDVLEEPFLKAESEEEFKRLMENVAESIQREFGPWLFPHIQKTRNDLKFPKKTKTQQIFFADSLAALGRVSPRRSRDIVAEGREEKRKKHKIIRQEYYIECTCGYEGPAKDGACPECATRTVGLLNPLFPTQH